MGQLKAEEFNRIFEERVREAFQQQIKKIAEEEAEHAAQRAYQRVNELVGEISMNIFKHADFQYARDEVVIRLEKNLDNFQFENELSEIPLGDAKTTSIGELDISQRSRNALFKVAQAEGHEASPDLTIYVFKGLSWDRFSETKSVGDTTVEEIKSEFRKYRWNDGFRS